MIEYFLLQLTTIALEQQYEDNKGKYVHIKTYTSVFIITFLLYFYITLSISRIFSEDKDDQIGDKNEIKDNDNEKVDDIIKNKDNDINYNGDEIVKKDKDDEKVEVEKMQNNDNENKNSFKYKDSISKLSNDILDGTHGIFFFNGVFSLIFSAFYFSRVNFKDYIFENNINIIFVPILMNKFYYFTLNYYCSYTSEDNKKFDFISSSTIISLYMGIWDLIFMALKSIIKSISKEKYNSILFIVQIVISSIPSSIIAFFLIGGLLVFSNLYYLICCCCPWGQDYDEPEFRLFSFLFCILSFLFCGGGLWYDVKNPGSCDNACQDTYEFDCCCCCDCWCCDCCDCDCCCCCCDIDSRCYSKRCDNCWDWARHHCCYFNC